MEQSIALTCVEVFYEFRKFFLRQLLRYGFGIYLALLDEPGSEFCFFIILTYINVIRTGFS